MKQPDKHLCPKLGSGLPLFTRLPTRGLLGNLENMEGRKRPPIFIPTIDSFTRSGQGPSSSTKQVRNVPGEEAEG